MTKDLEKEYLEDLDHYDEGMGIHSTSYKRCKERLIRLAKIDSASPSEALEKIKQAFGCAPAYYGLNLDFEILQQALLKAEKLEKENAEYKALLEEYEHYKIFTELFFDVFKVKYDGNKYTLTLTPYEQYDIENIDFKICLIKEDADKILKAIEVLASEETDE